MTLSIVIVSYNVRDFLEQCLKSVIKSSLGIKTEIFVVDNNSADGTIPMLRTKFSSHPEIDIHLILNQENLGFARANNQALKRCKGRYILVLNPDTLLSEDTLRRMIEFMEKPESKQIGASGCKLLNADGTFQLSCRRSFPSPEVSLYKLLGLSSLFPKSPRFAQYNLTFRSENETYEIDALMGAFMFLRREVLETVGLFDETFFMYGEDLDWCYRIKKGGWKIVYFHETQIIHYKGESTKKQSFNYVLQFYEAMLIFVKKYYNSSSWFVFILTLGIYLRASLSVVKRILDSLIFPILDAFFLTFSIVIGFYIKFYVLKQSGYPEEFLLIVLPSYLAVWMMCFLSFGVYRSSKLWALKTLWLALFAGFILSSSMTFFFNQFAFSRIGLATSFILALFFLSSWRLIAKLGSTQKSGSGSLLKRAAIFGTSEKALTLFSRIDQLPTPRSRVVGFISSEPLISFDALADFDTKIQRLGKEAPPLLGSKNQLKEVVRVNKISEILITPSSVSNTEILTLISQLKDSSLDFRFVSEDLDVIISKGSIDPLSPEPLSSLGQEIGMQSIEYNLLRPEARFTKRLFDLMIFPVILLFSPLIWLRGRKDIFIKLWFVFMGRMTFVGASHSVQMSSKNGLYVGKEGVWTLAKLSGKTGDQAENTDVYYAKNSTRFLDLEILIKSILLNE